MHQKSHHIPQRTCIVCFSKKSPEELMAVTRLPSGEVKANMMHTFSGRSAYICRQKACLEKARNSKRNPFRYHLKVDFPKELWEELGKDL